MVKKIYSIFDKVAGEFSQPFYCNNDEVAKRIVTNSFLSSKDVKLHSCDYLLYSLGDLNIANGKLCSSIENICCLSDLLSDEVAHEI